MTEGLIVGKYGSRAAVGDLDLEREEAGEFVQGYAQQWRDIFAERDAILVTSGAARMGKKYWASIRGKDFEDSGQPFAMMGNPIMMTAWRKAFAPLGVPVAELLVTRRELDDTRFPGSEGNIALNAMRRNLALKILTIANYNDALNTEELDHLSDWGDNDYHAFHIARLMGAQTLYLATEAEGLHHGSGTIHYIGANDHDWNRARRHAGGPAEGGTGGMNSKVKFAIMAAELGIETIIASAQANAHNVLREIRIRGPHDHDMPVTYFEPVRAA